MTDAVVVLEYETESILVAQHLYSNNCNELHTDRTAAVRSGVQ